METDDLVPATIAISNAESNYCVYVEMRVQKDSLKSTLSKCYYIYIQRLTVFFFHSANTRIIGDWVNVKEHASAIE